MRPRPTSRPIHSTLVVLLMTLAPYAVAQANSDDINPAAKSIAMAATLPGYDVASIRQNKSGNENWTWQTTNDGYIAKDVTFLQIIQAAYNLNNPELISGLSGQVASARFDISTKVLPPDDAKPVKFTDEQLQAMLIPLIADRFHLRVHVVPMRMTIYEIVAPKDGPKFKISEPETHSGSMNFGISGNTITITAKKTSMSELADILSGSPLHRIVVDRTSLKGEGDFSLKWSTDDADQQGGTNNISIFTAIQDQLGLKLQPAKFPVDTLVIDHVEMPTEN